MKSKSRWLPGFVTVTEEDGNKWTPPTLNLDLDMENDVKNAMEQIMIDNGMEKQTIPNALIDEHLRKIKDLSGQADDHEAEGRRRLTLAKEARLGIAALEAANKVLQGGLPAALPATSALADSSGVSFSAAADKIFRNSALEDKGER